MTIIEFKNKFGIKSKIGSAIVVLSLLSGTAYAQRDPAYQNARTNGQIGEQIDGYLAVIGNQSPEIDALTNKINILRKQVYTKTAASQNVTVKTAAFLGGCKNIQRTVAGEKYQAPDGSWKTRGAGAPELDSNCP